MLLPLPWLPGGGWEHFTTTTVSAWIDNHPPSNPGQPEIREYHARYWDKGKPNGDWSTTAHATLGV